MKSNDSYEYCEEIEIACTLVPQLLRYLELVLAAQTYDTPTREDITKLICL